MRIWAVLCIATLILGTVVTTVCANSSVLGPSGSGVMPMTTHSTAMWSEVVTMTIVTGEADNPYYYYHSLELHVHAKFDLVSTEHETVVIGYPLGPAVFGVHRPRVHPDNLEISVDGKPVEFQVVADVAAEAMGSISEQWAAWEMELVSGIIHTVIVSYAQPLQLSRIGSRLNMDYTLRTGSGWSEPIGAALIRLSAPEQIRSAHLHDETTPGYTIDNGCVIWRYDNLVPDFDIEISMDNVLFRSDLDLLITSLANNNFSDEVIIRGSRVLAAIVNEILVYGSAHLEETIGLSQSQIDEMIDNLIGGALTTPYSPEAANYLVALLAAMFRCDPDQPPHPEILPAMETALFGGYSLSWWDSNEAAEASARLRMLSGDSDRNERLARAIGTLIGGWSRDPELTCYVTWEDVVDHSGLYTSLVRVSLHSDTKTRRILAAGTDPQITYGWTLAGPTVTFARELCPRRLGALATSAIFYAAVSVAEGGRELAADIAALDHIPGNEATIQYTISAPGGVQTDHVPTYIDPSSPGELVILTWPQYRLLWLIYLIPPVVGVFFFLARYRRRRTLTS